MIATVSIENTVEVKPNHRNGRTFYWEEKCNPIDLLQDYLTMTNPEIEEKTNIARKALYFKKLLEKHQSLEKYKQMERDKELSFFYKIFRKVRKLFK